MVQEARAVLRDVSWPLGLRGAPGPRATNRCRGNVVYNLATLISSHIMPLAHPFLVYVSEAIKNLGLRKSSSWVWSP